MLVVIGLLILAVMLFGASRVLGVFAQIMGFLCASIALFFAAQLVIKVTGWSFETALWAFILFVLAIIAIFAAVDRFFVYTPGRGWHRK